MILFLCLITRLKRYNLNDMNMERELQGLKSALDFFKMKEGVIVTHDQTDFFETDGAIIRLIPA